MARVKTDMLPLGLDWGCQVFGTGSSRSWTSVLALAMIAGLPAAAGLTLHPEVPCRQTHIYSLSLSLSPPLPWGSLTHSLSLRGHSLSHTCTMFLQGAGVSSFPLRFAAPAARPEKKEMKRRKCSRPAGSEFDAPGHVEHVSVHAVLAGVVLKVKGKGLDCTLFGVGFLLCFYTVPSPVIMTEVFPQYQ